MVIEPLLIDEDYYARVEGREIISNLSKAAGLATMIATMRPGLCSICLLSLHLHLLWMMLHVATNIPPHVPVTVWNVAMPCLWDADIDHPDEYVRNTTARAFAVVASALGIPALVPFLKAVCMSRKSWEVWDKTLSLSPCREIHWEGGYSRLVCLPSFLPPGSSHWNQNCPANRDSHGLRRPATSS